jgi:two-component system chemotaxis response regulator CheB
MAMQKIHVLVVDDSALIRKLLPEILQQDPDIEVIGTANDPFMAREMIKQLNPDVLTLDVEMPKMDGITFLRNLMRLRPMPVVMVSTLTEAGADITFEALELGAVDFVAKPKIDISHTLEEYSDELIAKVKAAAGARIQASNSLHKMSSPQSVAASGKESLTPLRFKTTDTLIAIGASTGGTEAIKEVLIRMPADAPGIVITQHIPEAFSRPFAERMNGASAMTVCQAEDGQQILPGNAYIAPGNQHLMVERSGTRFLCRLDDGPPVNRHKPSVDVMFRSVAQNIGANAISVLLTGMGCDGAQGMKEMKEMGAATLAQDEKSSVVWGMPGEAVKLGCVDQVLPLQKITDELLKLTNS